MTSTRWSAIEDLFHRAADLPPAERPAFLDAECPAAMRTEVESLLAHDASPGAGIQGAVAREAEGIADEEIGWLIGRHIGPYRVTGVIGEGGMGAVYSATRDDDQYRKEVAIKLVRHGFETGRLLERFRTERQILSALEHPYVARMLDGGATRDGFPYIVMERVDGVAITAYAQQQRLSVGARLRLFQKVCEAVQYAHANLIVHRDLKPANIAVTVDGTPKLLDFGIATLLTPDPAGAGERFTSVALMTPDYASPEQVRGLAVTTATDIYSLGAVLYELLAGRPPHRLAGRTPADILTSIGTVEPDLPSKAAEPSIAPARDLAGDLDNIVLMALRKDPDRRYRSVEQFAEDLQRHLDGRPVIASADTITYRVRKFVGRNRWAIAAVTATMVMLAGGVIVARRAAARAERRFAQVRQLAGNVLFEIYDSVEPLAGSTASRQLIVKNALEYLNSLSADAAGDASLLDELAGAYRRVGDVQGNDSGANLGDARGALESYGRGVALARSAVAAQPANATFQVTLGAALVALARRQYDSSDVDGARRSGEEAIALLEQLTARDASNQAALEKLGDAYGFLGSFIGRKGDPAQANDLLKKAIAVDQRLVDTDPSASHRALLAASWGELGTFQDYLSETLAARQAYQRTVEIMEALVRDFPDKADYRRLLMVNYANLTDNMSDACFSPKPDSVASRPYYEKVVAIAESLAAADPLNQMAQVDVAQSLYRMGCLEEVTGHLAEAAADERRALALAAAAARAPDVARSTLTLQIRVLQRLGQVLLAQGRVSDAVDRYREAMDVVKGLARREPGLAEIAGRFATGSGLLAVALARSGNRAALDDLAREAEPQLARATPSVLSPSMRAYPAVAMFRFSEAYTSLHDAGTSCLWLGRSARAWADVQSGGGIPPDAVPVHADTLRLVASCPAATSR